MPRLIHVCCPQCEDQHSLEILDRAFSYRQVTVTDTRATAEERSPGWDHIQEVAVICRACGWSHNLRDCTATLTQLLSGQARCSHE